MPAETPHKVRYRHTSQYARVRRQQGPKPEYYDQYRFSGRTFRVRNKVINDSGS